MSVDLNEHPYAKTIWDTLCKSINNEYGVAALMGNLQAESGLYPNRVQGDVPYSSYSAEYTAKVDNGTISKDDFIHKGPNGGGYGLAQWTYYTRKQALYEMWVDGNYDSIGSVELACAYLLYELENSFPSVLTTIQNTTDILTASNAVLHDFESPADQSDEVEELRCSMGETIYNTFRGSTPTPAPTPTKRKGLHKLLLYAIGMDDF